MQVKSETEKDIEKRCENLKEQNESLINGVEAAEKTINNLWFASRILSAKRKTLKTKYKIVSDLYCRYHSSCNHYDYWSIVSKYTYVLFSYNRKSCVWYWLCSQKS